MSDIDAAHQSERRAYWRDRAETAEARVRELEAALREVRYIVPRGTCSKCEGFNAEVEEANNIIDRALAAAGGAEGDTT